ncbi:hypothetical protein FHX33_003489 [Leifsonia aquatica]|uniref:Uncharacterized protein n=1 Tax=Leifsonia aquatica TaxID=144185 RepID=A0A7W4UYP5_LEIAQ|nr:hypothetical protein [Leifsonia aquatica]
MVSKGRHSKSAVAKALDALPSGRFDIDPVRNGHRWASVVCRECTASFSVWSTPKNADNHAKQIERFAAKHEHMEGEA